VGASHDAISTQVPNGPHRPCPIRKLVPRTPDIRRRAVSAFDDWVRWHLDRLHGRSANDLFGYLPRLLTDRALDDVGPSYPQQLSRPSPS
jgi:hypothetical protein